MYDLKEQIGDSLDNLELFKSLHGGLFGDERDEIAKRIIEFGGSEAFVKENLKKHRYKYTHDPVPFSKTIPALPENPFVSDPLGEKIDKKVSRYISL